MPIMDVELVTARGEEPREGLAAELADAAAEVFESPPGRTWVRVRTLSSHDYAENGGGPEAGVSPVFVRVLKAVLPEGAARSDEMRRLTDAVALACGRAAENVHVLYEPETAGRIAFGGAFYEG